MRLELFTQRERERERAAYQAGYCWAQMVIKAPELPSPNEWGWKKTDEGWTGQHYQKLHKFVGS